MGYRDGSRTAAESKMECFVIIVNSFQPVTIITKDSILDVVLKLESVQINKSIAPKFIIVKVSQDLKLM